ncbi:hypothetical protein ASG90_10015 [Nocardioides sp. Soil797]|nr:hypothetical protein ASG90_10015 [Nocardioides sp. Soil797]
MAIVSADGNSNLRGFLTRKRPDVDVVEVSQAINGWARHARLMASAPFDVIVDVSPRAASRYGRLRDLLFLVRPTGSLVLRDVARRPESDNADARDDFHDILDRLVAILAGDEPEPADDARRIEWDPFQVARATETLEFVGSHAIFTRAGMPALAKMSESAMNTLLELEPEGDDHVVRVIPGQHVRSRAVLRYSGDEPPPKYNLEYDAPDASLRVYHDVVAAPGQVLANDRFVLPDSFRHNARPRLVNSFLDELGPRFANLAFDTADLPKLAGTYYHLDNEIRGHFGHVMTEQVSRMWAWPEVKQENPGVKALMFLNRGREMSGWEYAILAAAGIERDDVLFLDEPVRVERMVSASPLFSNPEYAHPAILETWQRIGDSLASGAQEREWPARFFCSRTIRKRGCTNTDEVEELFRAQGFEVVLPETMPLPDQVQLFRQAEVVAGFAGSGLFQLQFTPTPKRVITIGHARYNAANEFLMASLLGHQLDQVISVPDKDHFQSSFTFDDAREGRWLAEVFASLS